MHDISPVSILPAIGAMLVAIVTAYLIRLKFGEPPAQGRFASIDGLRGYLAFGVFMHHACIWYFYLRTGQWAVLPSNFYIHCGQDSVALFFMVTAFLFCSKMLDSRGKSVDFERLYISRFMRLVPLYLFSMLLVFLTVAVLSHGSLREPLVALSKNLSRWLGFALFGMPDINGVEHTFTIDAGVPWSLPYEWFFYFLLPVVALVLRAKASAVFLLFGFAVLLSLRYVPLSIRLFEPFLGGALAAVLVRSPRFCVLARSAASSFLVIALGAFVILRFPSAYEPLPLVFLGLMFSLIAGGNSLFGVLVHPVSRTLGEMAYSIYLLHGIALFVLFTFIVGPGEARTLSATAHWVLVIATAPFVVLCSFGTYRFIERPAIDATGAIVEWLRSCLAAPVAKTQVGTQP